MTNKHKKKILAHVCCAPCTTYSVEKLINDGYFTTAIFYNPNIHPLQEYTRRLEELKTYAENRRYNLVILEDSFDVFFQAVKGLEEEKEGGKRCEACFRLRLEKIAEYAKTNGFDAFTTVLTISPHKNSKVINQIGIELSAKYDIEFIEENFKKQGGFKKSLLISKEYGLYRQSYCGCVYSHNKKS